MTLELRNPSSLDKRKSDIILLIFPIQRVNEKFKITLKIYETEEKKQKCVSCYKRQVIKIDLMKEIF